MLIIILILTVIALLSYLFYKFGTKNADYFADQKIPALKPEFLYGSSRPLMTGKLGRTDYITSLYRKLPNQPVFAFLMLRQPTFLIRDPDLIKKVAIKYFDHFVDHKSLINSDHDTIFSKNLLALKGQEWKVMRTTLSPIFTGSKMRTMFQLISACGDQLNAYLTKEFKTNLFVDADVKELFSRYSSDVIATCAFGIEVNSHKNPENYFYKMGSKVMSFAGWMTKIKFIGFIFMPKLMAFLKIKFLNPKDENMFKTILMDAMNRRDQENIVRPDLVNVLINLRNGKLSTVSDKENLEVYPDDEQYTGKVSMKSEWTDDELQAQCLIFFIAGFETVSDALSFIAYELALNPDIQTKLQQEIDDISDELNGELLRYEDLQKLKYLDMVVSESLRKWAPASFTDRICTSDVTIEHDGVDVNFKKGDHIWIPMHPIHHDEKYYPNPEQFDPERFSDERKHEIKPMTYLPFGVGPRNCIGSRFALMELKTSLFYILKNFIFKVYNKTEVPLKFGTKATSNIPNGGLWIRIAPRKIEQNKD